ncbi:Periplakin 190 kDa paraneoplastic pemphigus antigen 195 kDa cornified envelope precursor protein [Triplophysa tibetana]|uniref:Periplakin 190 kDa paraneoplastic pemphigus antigen 195 kDa cornified envelope protein n=1 Tax=Triplophysa tibetana TaxID=1572043 RepID=A0A5A9MYM0_9TELE|nr:Periplakin 190 kDa paraneoplastic pemphigus antigen 195 kDa cornified envelope precursor protein [Triplophysa tibetana]
MQINSDEVEKNIIQTEQNFKKDIKKIDEGNPLLYKEDTNKRILNSLVLLDGLDDNAVQATCFMHPQAEMIEKDIKNLRIRVMEIQKEHNRIYNITRSEHVPIVNWMKIIDEKLVNLNNKGFGEDLPTIENAVGEHNIFHSEVKALPQYINRDRGSDEQQAKYNKLLAASTARQKNLLRLRDYIQRCTTELSWMDQQAEEKITYDWSDANLDYPLRKRQYENFIAKCLESMENKITRLNDDGEQLIEQNHPGKNVIAAHTEAVHADWKEYLNLLICEENHLKNMDDYHKFHKDVQDTNDLLKRMEIEINQKYEPEFKDMYQIEGLIKELDDQAKAMDDYSECLKGLQERSLQVLPLIYRRETPQELLPITALCEYETFESTILRGNCYTLLRNYGPKWDVKDSSGCTMNIPGVCFIIPPTDPEAVFTTESLINQHKGIKQRMAVSKNALQTRLEELRRERTSGQGEQFIDKHRLKLINRVTNVDAILDELLQNKIISAQEYDDIRSKSTSSEKMRDLFTGPIKSGGTLGKDALYETLMNLQPLLMKDLGTQ